MGLRIMTQQKAAEGPEPLGHPHACLFLLARHIASLSCTWLKRAHMPNWAAHISLIRSSRLLEGQFLPGFRVLQMLYCVIYMATHRVDRQLKCFLSHETLW